LKCQNILQIMGIECFFAKDAQSIKILDNQRWRYVNAFLDFADAAEMKHA
jgi:hypothetical protein